MWFYKLYYYFLGGISCNESTTFLIAMLISLSNLKRVLKWTNYSIKYITFKEKSNIITIVYSSTLFFNQ